MWACEESQRGRELCELLQRVVVGDIAMRNKACALGDNNILVRTAVVHGGLHVSPTRPPCALIKHQRFADGSMIFPGKHDADDRFGKTVIVCRLVRIVPCGR